QCCVDRDSLTPQVLAFDQCQCQIGRRISTEAYMPSGGSSQAPGSLIRTQEGLITFWSTEMEQRYGFPAEAALGQTTFELLRPRHWRTLDEIEAILIDRSEWNGGLILHRMDGQPVVVANYWYLHAAPGDGAPLVTEVHSDI